MVAGLLHHGTVIITNSREWSKPLEIAKATVKTEKRKINEQIFLSFCIFSWKLRYKSTWSLFLQQIIVLTTD